MQASRDQTRCLNQQSRAMNIPHTIPGMTTCNTEFAIAMRASRYLRPLRILTSTSRAMDFGQVTPGPNVGVAKVGKLAQRVERVLHEKTVYNEPHQLDPQPVLVSPVLIWSVLT